MSNSIFGFEKPEHSPGFLLWQTTVSWQRLIKKTLEAHNLSHAQFVVMAILLWLREQKTDVVQIDIVKMSKLDKMTVSKSLKKLVTLGFVSRQENKHDTRAKTVCLTKSGISITKKLVPKIEEIDSDFFGNLKDNEQGSLIKVLQKLVANKN